MEKKYTCFICGGTNSRERVSKKRPCASCARRRYLESLEAMRTKEGPMYDKWLRNWTIATTTQIGG